ncbi:hypothetical protein BO78DRAFT_471492 [Aspergillus sclerotiicarbonarius CBS 121057]|uniref:Uncharacterized protein n=1 Tax=Aspergillus sclerotiicarbonarius (strain CBS 121057 / IBT 28362) TaxID=1448318 RepID=A0A319EKD3_ASPSB|nr:hypothetical protein BO78DRAFT_471492 [Aspergillus sclerotiicarbonarius CBS 121057]
MDCLFSEILNGLRYFTRTWVTVLLHNDIIDDIIAMAFGGRFPVSPYSESTDSGNRLAAGAFVRPQQVVTPPQRPAREAETLRAALDARHEEAIQIRAELSDAQKRIRLDAEIIETLQAKIDQLQEVIMQHRLATEGQYKASPELKYPKRNHQSRYSASTAPHHTMTSSSPFSTPSVRRGGVFDQPPPSFNMPSGGRGTNARAAVVVKAEPSPSRWHDHSPRDLFTTTPQHAAAGSDSPQGPVDTSSVIDQFTYRYRDLFKKTEAFGQVHGNLPDFGQDMGMEGVIKEYLMTISNKNHAAYLLGNPSTRFTLLTKAINYYLVQEALKITAVRGFEDTVDRGIEELTQQVCQDTSPIIRHMLINAMVTVIEDAMEVPEFADFSKQKAQAHVKTLWQYIGPLTNDPNNVHGMAWADLATIMSEAQNLAVDMFRHAFEYHFDFPEINEPFNPATMINRDYFIKGDPQALKNNDNRVGLGITPIIRIRDLVEQESKLVYFADVLLLPSPGH